MQDSRIRIVLVGLLVAVLGLTAAVIVMAQRPVPPLATPNIPEIQTQAVGAYIAQLTAHAPLATSTRTVSSSPTITISSALTGTPNCLGLHFLRDVTIPDNTAVTPAQVFTKTWQVENSGTCAWEPGFQVVLIGGLAMGGSPFRVAQRVGPGGSIQVSIKMVAPTNQTGVVQGTWKMADSDGVQFGDYLSVVVVVSSATGRIPSPTNTAVP